MNTNKILECESRRLNRYKKYLLLPNYFKMIGAVLLILSLFALPVLSFFTEITDVMKVVTGKIILVSLLLFALAREKVEDELIEKIRGQAYTFAFVWGVIYTLAQPVINYLVAAVVKPEKAVFAELSVFIILWSMLVIYIMFFYLLKRTR